VLFRSGEGGTTDDPIYDFGNKRVGETPIDAITTAHIIWNFDNDNESNTAPGDSGGPAFITIDGQQYIAGITSGGDSDPHRLGDRSFDTRVDPLANWIDSVLANVDQDTDTDPDADADTDPDADTDTDPNPDPNSELDGDLHVDKIGTDATRIELEDGVFGFIDAVVNSADDQDVFQITLNHGGTVYLDLFSWEGDLDTKLYVFDLDGTIVSDNNDSQGSTDSSLILELDAGTYYLVATSDDASTGEYGLDVYVTTFGDFGDFDEGDFDDWDSGDWIVDQGDFGDWDFDDWDFGDQESGDGGFDDEWTVGDDNWDWNGHDHISSDALDDVMGEEIDWWSDAFGLA
jgi:hypothetical protein